MIPPDTLQVTTPTEREIVVTRAFDAPRHLLFDAFTKPELIRRWLLGPPGWTMPVCEVDLKVGGSFRWVWRSAEGAEMGLRGVYREVTPPDRIVHNESFDQDWTGGETLVTTTFDEHAGRTTVTMTILYSSTEARDGALQSGMTEGMSHSYNRLAEVLSTLL